MTVLEATTRRWQRKIQADTMRELLLQLLERRFGPLPEEKRKRVEAITSHIRLDQILTAQSLDEMGL